jgi:hypothetical protein
MTGTSDDGLGVPNCPSCLTPMDLAGSEIAPYWRCDDCGLTALVTPDIGEAE